jgi:DNA-binding MarR family transcriptional regulator/GNAT superfamily N-acetyltransferase
MDDVATKQVRSFNRTVTQRVGALDDHYLARDRPLGACRVLWEVGEEGSDVRTLRARLDLDSGYLSRLLRNLEGDGLVSVDADGGDRRVRTVRLTAAGREERQLLDGRSDELAWSLLAPLGPSDRVRLVDAMAVVERLLTGSSQLPIVVEDPTSAAARHCLDAYFAELDGRFDAGFDPDRSISADAAELTEPAGLLVVARRGEEPVACGALKLHGVDPAEVKRMWVSTAARGLGLGRRILERLEDEARARGVRTLRLETNRTLHEAINLYRSAGYVEVAPFSDEPYAHHWFEKSLPEPTS